ncbi:U3 small nucleolar RNA-associated protein 14 homolog A [Calliopsis andreniformis]|uniref:U3 small nucleolar RNA-associated protein 14 homolog A n=1 Tax=Calliopsis andreniformis TaxID=337506 RepID=UPI003FCE4CA0
MSDSEFLDDTEQDVSESHSKLLEAVSQLDKGQKIKKAERNEPTLEVSEFHLVKSGISDSDAIQVHDLAKVLGRKGHHLNITKNLEAAKKKTSVLQKPLEKPAAERIKRIVGFENTKKELKKWNAIITKNRTAESLNFPLNQSSMRLEPTKEFVSRFRIQSDLEKELAALEPQKENIEQKEDEFSLTLKEVIMKRKEAARIRAQQSYREAKARRQGKIKSKKFHRVQRKEKIKLQLKEFEELQKTNPEAALEKLEQLDKTRAEERMSLRHKNTGKWAKSKQIRAKYDTESRQQLAQQLIISQELTQKVRKSNDSDEEEDEDNSPSTQLVVNDKENPWVGDVKTESEIDEFIKGYRKYWDERNTELQKQKPDVNRKNITNNEHSRSPITSEDKNIVHNVESKKSEIQNHGKITEIIKSDEQKTSLENVNFSTISKVHDTVCKTQSLETQSHKQDPETRKSNDVNESHNTVNKITKRKGSDDKRNEKAKLKKRDLRRITATSAWNVETIETDNVQTMLDTSKVNIPNDEKINKMFDIMEEKMQARIKSKLERVTEEYNKVTKQDKIRKNVTFKERDEFDGLEFQASKRKPVLDVPLDERANSNLTSNTESRSIQNTEQNNTFPMNKPNTSKPEIDPNKYINVKPKHLNTGFPADITGGNEALDDSEDDEEKLNVISEAFADDDVVEEFRKEKQDEVEKSRPEDIDLFLPGWGSWGGKNVKVSKRKKRRFILKFPKDIPRKDENKGDVIIFEGDKKIKEHQVTDLPYPFTSVKDYEASIRMPIGRNFVPENAHIKLIEPAVKTKIGTIIEPMTEDVLVQTKGKKPRKSITKKNSKTVKNKKVK